MEILIAAGLIVIATGILIASIYLRKRCRENIQHLRICFTENNAKHAIDIKVSRFFWAIFTSLQFVPHRLLASHSPIFYELKKNNKKILTVPNFWTNYNGFTITRITKNHTLRMDITLILRDPAMARYFRKQLQSQGFDPNNIAQDHNKILISWDLSRQEDCASDPQHEKHSERIL
jgi:hypothetical protein